MNFFFFHSKRKISGTGAGTVDTAIIILLYREGDDTIYMYYSHIIVYKLVKCMA